MLLFVLFVSFVVNTAETTTKNTKSTKKIEPGFQPSSISVPSLLSVVKSPPIFGVKAAPTGRRIRKTIDEADLFQKLISAHELPDC
jgi:hypothetical protein